jgi:hypothetical protein
VGSLYRAGAVSAGLAVISHVAALVIVASTSQPPTSGGAQMLEYVDAHRTVYIVRQLLWLAPSLPLMVVFLALAAAPGQELRGDRRPDRDRVLGGVVCVADDR